MAGFKKIFAILFSTTSKTITEVLRRSLVFDREFFIEKYILNFLEHVLFP